MIRFATLLICLIGCSQSPAKLRLDGVGISEDTVPLVFALKLTNEGGTTAKVDGVAATFLTHSRYGTTVAMADSPKDLDCSVEFRDVVLISPGETVDVPCVLKWKVDEFPPPMLAIVTATFATGPVVIESKPLSFILQSRPGLLDAACGKKSDPNEGAT